MSGQQHAPAALYPRERPSIHCTGGWVGLKAGLDGRKISPPSGIRFRIVQPVVSRYTDWATLPTIYIYIYIYIYISTSSVRFSAQKLKEWPKLQPLPTRALLLTCRESFDLNCKLSIADGSEYTVKRTDNNAHRDQNRYTRINQRVAYSPPIILTRCSLTQKDFWIEKINIRYVNEGAISVSLWCLLDRASLW